MRSKMIFTYILTGAALMLNDSNDTRADSATKDIVQDYLRTHQVCDAPKPTFTVLPIRANAAKHDVVYHMNDSTKVTRRGGTRAWRNCNPGNIRGGDFSRRMGAIGNAGGFAVFPDEETGSVALDSLLASKNYAHLTVGATISKYAPKCENDTDRYKRQVRKMTGLNLQMRLCDLNPKQRADVIAAIKHIEGWREGTQIYDTIARLKTPQTR